MAYINKIIALVICVLVFTCANSNDGEASNTLKSYLNATTFERGLLLHVQRPIKIRAMF